jgi:hypothetical protein
MIPAKPIPVGTVREYAQYRVSTPATQWPDPNGRKGGGAWGQQLLENSLGDISMSYTTYTEYQRRLFDMDASLYNARYPERGSTHRYRPQIEVRPFFAINAAGVQGRACRKHGKAPFPELGCLSVPKLSPATELLIKMTSEPTPAVIISSSGCIIEFCAIAPEAKIRNGPTHIRLIEVNPDSKYWQQFC